MGKQVLTRNLRPNANILASINVRALGDAIMQLAWLAAMKLHYDPSSSLNLVTNPFGEAFEAALKCCPYVDGHAVVVDGQPDEAIKAVDPLVTFAFDSDHLFHLNLPLLSVRAPFVVPEADRPALAAELLGRGANPDRWIVAMHCRHDASFRARSLHGYMRDVNAEPFSALADYIIDELGGQVVWLGHPGMPAAPDRPGVVSLIDASMMLQYFATASARYMVGCDSGPTMVASAFEVPVLKSNSIYDSGCWNNGDIMLPKTLMTADGHVVRFVNGHRHLHWLPKVIDLEDFVLLDNTYGQLRYCADLLQKRTHGVDGWRPLQQPRRLPHPPGVFPMMTRRPKSNQNLIDLSHLLGRPVVDV